MRKLFIILFIFLGIIYFTTGRYVQVGANLKEQGPWAIMEEPAWLSNWMGRQWRGLKGYINNFISDNRLSTRVYTSNPTR